jgi:hypothetical protein
LAGDGGLLHHDVDEGIVEQRLLTYSCCSGKILVWSSRPDDGGILVPFYLLGASLVEQCRWTEDGGGDVMSCLADRCYAESCLFGKCYARRICHGVSNNKTGKGYADLCTEDGLAVWWWWWLLKRVQRCSPRVR